MENGIYRHSTLGTPQGGIVSPLLANVYLDKLDQWIKQWTEVSKTEGDRRRRNGKGNWAYVRYADDFLVLTNGSIGNAERMEDRVRDFVNEELDLTLSEKKTEIVHAKDGFEFLGYNFYKKEETRGTRTTIPKEAMADIKQEIRTATGGSTQTSIRAKIKSLNAVLRGWANYYKYATNASDDLTEINQYAWMKTADWLARKKECSWKYLIGNVLEGRSPLKINGVSLAWIGDKSTTYRDSPVNKGHPYLEGEIDRQEKLPQEAPWIGERTDKDKRWKALERDDWTCQNCGRDLERAEIEVHHKRARTSLDGDKDRVENLVSLCAPCHKSIEKNREYAK